MVFKVERIEQTILPSPPWLPIIVNTPAPGSRSVHPHGEIDLVMPQEGDARFDGQGAGWTVYGPGSAHRPTVRGGRALVLYLLPQGEVRFTEERRQQ